MIKPHLPLDHPDRLIECEEALDEPLRDLVDAAVLAGWTPEEAFAALASVAAHRWRAYRDDPASVVGCVHLS